MSFLSMRIGFLFLVAAFFQSGSCNQCKDLETGDISDFDIKKYAGKYQAVMGILGDGPLSKLKWDCNGLDFIQHDHPNGGVNVALTVYSDSRRRIVLDKAVFHMNSTTDPYLKEVDGFHPLLETFANLDVKVLGASQKAKDLFVYSLCVKDEDNENDVHFHVLVLRREGSTLPVTEVQVLLPESIKNNPALVKLCEN